MKKQLLAVMLGLFGLSVMVNADAYRGHRGYRCNRCAKACPEVCEKPCALTCENTCGPKPCCYTVHTYKKYHKPCSCTTWSCPEGSIEEGAE
ncbi:hypothetical protein M1446_01965 [Candidatus Dependentiae bacterium]|nr:hypothetical protein [Candidatus Dependentiae bacterium]